MSDLKCYIVRDLLPLYIDAVCSEETRADIEAHLRSCESCRTLYEQMQSDLPVEIEAPEFEEKKVFRRVRGDLLVILVALFVTGACFALNLAPAWMGGPASVGNVLVTVGYILFWTVFTVKARKYMPLVNLSMTVSCITLIASVAGLGAAESVLPGGFLIAGIASCLAVPFYGLRCFLEWDGVYLAGAVLSALWTGYAFRMKYRLMGAGNTRQSVLGIRRRLILTGAFLLSLTPMLLPQYGFSRGVQEIGGFLNLVNPIGAASVLLYLLGVWCIFRRRRINRILCLCGTAGIVVAELWTFLTWHIQTITGAFSLAESFRGAFPEFYIGLAVSGCMVAAYCILDRKLPES